MSLFAKLEPEDASAGPQPLAERMRPRMIEEFAGQQELLGPGKPLRVAIEHDDLGSMILWGPPGCGKTTLARLIARRTHSEFVAFSAVLSGIREIKDVMAAAEHSRRAGRRTIVFVDEVHRFNKAQQDAFLPHVEAGNITLIGATTENPSFEVIAPLLSRTRVYVLRALTTDEIVELLRRALADKERGLGNEHDRSRRRGDRAAGDLRQWRCARAAYNSLEAVVRAAGAGCERQARGSPRSCCCRKRCSGSSCSMTRAAKNTSISSLPCINRCAIPTPTPRSTGWRASSNPAKT